MIIHLRKTLVEKLTFITLLMATVEFFMQALYTMEISPAPISYCLPKPSVAFLSSLYVTKGVAIRATAAIWSFPAVIQDTPKLSFIGIHACYPTLFEKHLFNTCS